MPIFEPLSGDNFDEYFSMKLDLEKAVNDFFKFDKEQLN